MTEKREYKVDPLALKRLEICNKCKNLEIVEEKKKCSLSPVPILIAINVESHRCPLEKW